MSRKKFYRPVPAGVSFHPSVLAYLDRLCAEEGADRSTLINRIVRDYALRQGTPIELTGRPAGETPSAGGQSS